MCYCKFSMFLMLQTILCWECAVNSPAPNVSVLVRDLEICVSSGYHRDIDWFLDLEDKHPSEGVGSRTTIELWLST
jgi:hypothetical protein